MTEYEYEESKYILKAYSKSFYGQTKTDQLLKILRDNNNENKWVSKFKNVVGDKVITKDDLSEVLNDFKQKLM